jgi:uncharacterized protein YutE (UPF0331/DUF86 family)
MNKEELENELQEINNQIDELNERKLVLLHQLRDYSKNHTPPAKDEDTVYERFEGMIKDYRNTVSFIKTGKKLED